MSNSIIFEEKDSNLKVRVENVSPFSLAYTISITEANGVLQVNVILSEWHDN